MWKVLNSPIVIVFLSFFLLAGALRLQKPRLATELKAVSQELDSIIADSGTDSEKARAIRDFAHAMASNLKEGFSSGFGSNKSDDIQTLDSKEVAFLETKNLLVVEAVKMVPSNWDTQEKYIFAIRNDSDKYITSLHASLQFYKGDELVDCETKWLSDIKVLEPGQEVVVSQTRHLPKDDSAKTEAARDPLKVVVASFTVKDAPEQ